jgi:hypothetical protein
MVNRPVVVTAFNKNRKYRLIDIELDE